MIRKNIDLIPCVCLCYCERVVPHVGAWIETQNLTHKRRRRKSSPMWGRGLKQLTMERCINFDWSSPMWGRGLKPVVHILTTCVLRRPPCGGVD